MHRRWSGTLAVLLSLAPALGATTSLAAQDDDGRVRVFTFSGSRPRIGVVLDYRADKERDRLGAEITDVTEDGPAAKAGLKAGDIITRFNGVALGGVKADHEDDEVSGPATRLVELAAKLEPGDTVQLDYRRGSDARKATVVAQDLGGVAMGRNFRLEMPRMPRMRMERMPDLSWEHTPGFEFRMRRSDGLELAELSPELGEYFGTRTGVLVLKPGPDGGELHAGDVILSIDGRAPTSEAHARRILGSYDGGETAKLEIMRKQKKQTVSWKAPEHDKEQRWPSPTGRSRVKVERS